MAGICKYQYTPSELYRNPGTGSTCGRVTHHVYDVAEKRQVQREDGSAEWIETGQMLARQLPDPYCPLHGGTPSPEDQASGVVAGQLGDGETHPDIVDLRNALRSHVSGLRSTQGDVSALDAKLRALEDLVRNPAPASIPAKSEPATPAPLGDWHFTAPVDQAPSDGEPVDQAPNGGES